MYTPTPGGRPKEYVCTGRDGFSSGYQMRPSPPEDTIAIPLKQLLLAESRDGFRLIFTNPHHQVCIRPQVTLHESKPPDAKALIDTFLDLFELARPAVGNSPNRPHMARIQQTMLKIAFKKAHIHGYSSISHFTTDLYASAFSWRKQACGKAKCTADKPCRHGTCFATSPLELLPPDYAVYSAASSETIVSFLKLLHIISPKSPVLFGDVAATIPPYRNMWRYTFTPKEWQSLLTAVKPAPASAGMMWYLDVTHPEKSYLQHYGIDTVASGAGDSPRTTMSSMSESTSLSDFSLLKPPAEYQLIVGRWILLRLDGDPECSDALPAQTVEVRLKQVRGHRLSICAPWRPSTDTRFTETDLEETQGWVEVLTIGCPRTRGPRRVESTAAPRGCADSCCVHQ